ncbi:hypothetical protein Nwi_2672 [Nitrobacter winogradskyi Nb-255]|uniref:Uncharacterized protein n=1 Tax=Nitrobacter winogradskyi (strain ATCC 25391 / DSM 10237 / CIP 104748 / NCIMB 11846 / Nb-255) TaxID=323098 RepID=Q3SP66_NITWN|nr:hypothetical protein Nwi_2672 [Nitrobacter winogradskyi Nb-255]
MTPPARFTRAGTSLSGRQVESSESLSFLIQSEARLSGLDVMRFLHANSSSHRLAANRARAPETTAIEVWNVCKPTLGTEARPWRSMPFIIRRYRWLTLATPIAVMTAVPDW